MKFEREAAAGRNLFTGYGPGWVDVGGQRLTASAIVTGDHIVADWGAVSVALLTADHFAAIAALKPDIVLLGSGEKFAFPDPAVLGSVNAARIGIEVMDTKAACRTFNILQGEGRNVLAALIVEKA